MSRWGYVNKQKKSSVAWHKMSRQTYVGCHQNHGAITIVQESRKSQNKQLQPWVFPTEYYSSSLRIPFARLGRKSFQKTTRSTSSLLSTLGSSKSISKYSSPSVVKAGQLMSVEVGIRGSLIPGYLVENENKRQRYTLCKIVKNY